MCVFVYVCVCVCVCVLMYTQDKCSLAPTVHVPLVLIYGATDMCMLRIGAAAFLAHC